jgi:hypothetical protein
MIWRINLNLEAVHTGILIGGKEGVEEEGTEWE